MRGTFPPTRLLIALACLALASACASKPQPLPHQAGGLAAGDSARLSLLVTQIREQHPELEPAALKQGSQAADESAAFEPALNGEGIGLRPGLQVGAPERASLTLFLDKRGYNAGRAEISIGGREAETWRVVAHDLRGDVTGDFELLLALADGESRMRYLALLGGVHERGGKQWLAYEGTLVLPGPGVSLKQWQRVYWFDLGDEYPLEPLYWAKVVQAGQVLATLGRQASTLEGLRERIVRLQRDRESLAAQSVPPERAETQAQDLARRDQQIAGLQAEQDQLAENARLSLLDYWALRESIDRNYAAFSQSNAFSWRDRKQQQAWFDHWKQVEFHHPRIDEIQRRLGAFVVDPQSVEDARNSALSTINEMNNWARNPAKAEGEGR